MVTMIGTQAKFEDALYELCELDYDAIEAYQAAINRLENKSYIQKLEEFKKDHSRHVDDISNILLKHEFDAPEGPSAKNLLTQGKVVLGGLVGDKTILKAMLSNELDTNTAYERLNIHREKWEDAEQILKAGLEDERNHKQWIEQVLAV